jgi:hypothetical protein
MSKSLSVRHLAIVEAERLFIDIPKQMDRLRANVGSAQAMLQLQKFSMPLVWVFSLAYSIA